MTGLPGLSDLPLIGRLFANNRKEAHESDIVLTLTPHIVRVLDLSESDLRPFRLGRDSASPAPAPELPAAIPRDRDDAPDPNAPAAPPGFPQPRQPGARPVDPLKGTLPGAVAPILPPAPPPPPVKKGGGGL